MASRLTVRDSVSRVRVVLTFLACVVLAIVLTTPFAWLVRSSLMDAGQIFDDKYTLALGLSEFMGLYSSQWHLLMAAATVIIMPVAVLFFFAQRYFVEGVTLTGSKG